MIRECVAMIQVDADVPYRIRICSLPSHTNFDGVVEVLLSLAVDARCSLVYVWLYNIRTWRRCGGFLLWQERRSKRQL